MEDFVLSTSCAGLDGVHTIVNSVPFSVIPDQRFCHITSHSGKPENPMI